MAKLTIEGTVTQIERHVFPRGTRHGFGKVAMNNAEILRRRKILRAAFNCVRGDPQERATTAMLAHALGGKLPVTQTILDTAAQILLDRSTQ